MNPRLLRFGEALLAVATLASTTPGCSDTPERADGGGGDVDATQGFDAGAGADAAADAAADAGGDGGEPERIGMTGRLGSGTATQDGYAGTEEIFFLSDEGNGEAICRIGYSLTSTGGPVPGCDGCLWAFELVIAGASVAEERDVGCEATVGIDPARVGDLDGTHVFYGYHPTYMGHGSVLMSRMDSGEWAPETFASWDEATGAFSYRRIDGFPPY